MAKSSNFFGLRTGSTKSLTFSVYRGQQITKDRVTRISNPRTTAQMMQRALIPIVAAARTSLKGIVDHSFEGIAYGEASLKVFSSLNLRKDFLSVASYPPKGYSNMGFANLQISKGTIAEQAQILTGYDQFKFVLPMPSDAPALKFPAIGKGLSAAPIFNYLAKYATDNNIASFQPGTQVTPISVYTSDVISVNTPNGKKEVPLANYDITRFLIPGSDTSAAQIEDVNKQWTVETEIPTEGAEKADLISSDGITRLSFFKTSDGLVVDFETGNTPDGGGVILSRYSAGVWRRNSSRLEFKRDLNGFSFDDWVSAYGSSASSESEKYLNNGAGSSSSSVKPVKPAKP